MNVSIVTTGKYAESGEWVLTRMTIAGDEDQSIVISRCDDGSYYFSSLLIGDDEPVKSNIPTFEQCWNEIPALLGFSEIPNR